MTELKVDPERHRNLAGCGIHVRAMLDGSWGRYDIVALDGPSLIAWLKSRGGDNPWAEDVVGILLGHGHLHEVAEEAADDDRGLAHTRGPMRFRT